MLILKKSCKALITALCTLFIYSCSSNDELDINSYQLQSIQWKLSADDAEKVDTIELPPKTTSNNTEEPMSITFSFEENIKETSQFYSDDPELFNSLTLKENILVDITANAYKPQNKMFHFCKTFCSKITLVNTIQNVILNPI